MKKVSRVIIGGTLIALGCGCFLYPNFREWNTQREVESVIHKFDETYSKGIDSDITSEPVKTSDKSDSAEEYLNDKGIENSLVFEEYNMDFKMKFNGSTYYCELLVDNSLEEKTEYRKNISVEKLTTWFEKLNSNFGILFYYPRINRMYFYPVSNNMTLPEITDGKKIRQIKINDKCLL